MRVLVTGTSGFVGKTLLERRYGLDDVLTLSTNCGTSTDETLQSEYDVERCSLILKKYQPDAIVHLAGVMKSEIPEEYFRVNFHYANTLLASAREFNQSTKIVLIGTAAEYGIKGLESQPLSEINRCVPISQYGVSKLAQTELGLWYARNGMQVITCRPFNLIGPGQSDSFVLGKATEYLRLVRNTSFNESKVLQLGFLGDYRDFVDVRNFCEVVVRILDEEYRDVKILNICTGKPTLIRDAVDKAFELAKVPRHLYQEKKVSRLPTKVSGDTEQFKNMFNYELDFNMEFVLRDMLS